MAHNRKLVLGGVALTSAKLPARQTALALGRVRDDLEQEIIRSGYLVGAPFKWIGLVIRQGLKDDVAPLYNRIDVKDGELPLSIEVNTNSLVGRSEEQVSRIYRQATLKALIHVGEKNNIDVGRLKTLLLEADSVPNAY